MRKYLDDYSAYHFKKVLDIVWSRPFFCSTGLAPGLALPVCTERAFTGSRMHGSVEGSFNRLEVIINIVCQAKVIFVQRSVHPASLDLCDPRIFEGQCSEI